MTDEAAAGPSGGAPSPSQPKKKKLPFKRTVPRRQPPTPSSSERERGREHHAVAIADDDDDDDLGMFRRSNEVFPLALQEQERRMRRLQRRRSSAAAETGSEGEEHSAKRRKSRAPSEGDRDGSLHSPGGRRSRRDSATSVSTDEFVQAKSLSPVPGVGKIKYEGKGKGKEPERYSRSRSRSSSKAAAKPPKSPIVLLDDEDDVTVSTTTRPVARDSRSASRPRSAVAIISSSPAPVGEDELLFSNEPKAAWSPPRRDTSPGLEDPAVDTPEDEYVMYVLEAKEREARARAAAARASASAPESGDVQSSGSAGEKQHQQSERQQQEDSGGASADRAREPTIKVLVTSPLPDTRQIVARIRFTQPLSVVRTAWIEHQGANPAVKGYEAGKQIILTWRGKRIYNTVTCAGLGLELDARGKLRPADSYGQDNDAGYHRGGLHLEAWTEETYAEYVKEKERERLRLLGQLPDDEEEQGAPAATQDSVATDGKEGGERLLRVTLKAKDYEPLKTKVHAWTTAGMMLTVFRTMRNVPSDRHAALYFDGQRLDEAATAEDIELEDMDNLDVHIK
ncbi:hypothetical protein VTK73DRAFT_5646 [Phialemonium thermophilum]|uniref:Ubiquitin-like domain-containing protein n=1 Tax=Phialemonium thermophilum TaxID=223376 RepID=A0ABR3WMG9_9PEZI